MLTALVVDGQADARRRVTGLLRLGGWQVQEADGAEQALRLAAAADPDLVVTDVALPAQSGLTLLRHLRYGGSRARFVVVTAEPTDAVRAEAAAAGALACLATPVSARVLLDFLRSRTTGPAAQDSLAEITVMEDLRDQDLDAELLARLQEMYTSALPERLSAIARSTTRGDTTAVASAAFTLAGTSGQLGDPALAEVCSAIAHDARRGVLAHGRLVQLRVLAGV